MKFSQKAFRAAAAALSALLLAGCTGMLWLSYVQNGKISFEDGRTFRIGDALNQYQYCKKNTESWTVESGDGGHENSESPRISPGDCAWPGCEHSARRIHEVAADGGCLSAGRWNTESRWPQSRGRNAASSRRRLGQSVRLLTSPGCPRSIVRLNHAKSPCLKLKLLFRIGII